MKKIVLILVLALSVIFADRAGIFNGGASSSQTAVSCLASLRVPDSPALLAGGMPNVPVFRSGETARSVSHLLHSGDRHARNGRFIYTANFTKFLSGELSRRFGLMSPERYLHFLRYLRP